MYIIALFFILLTLIYWYGTRTFSYWKIRGIKHDKPVFLLGNNAPIYMMKKSITQLSVDMYWKYPNEKVVGFFRSMRPELVVRDPEIVKRVLVTNFASFHRRGMNINKNVEPLMRNLFFADGDLWRLLRQRMSPAFTSGKLRAMFPLVAERAERLQERTLYAASENHVVDARDLMARYTTDFIGACGFGLDANSLREENSTFRKLGLKIFQVSPLQSIIGMLKEVIPEIFQSLKYLGRIEKDLINLVKEIQKQRNYEPSGRNDFIDLLLECKKNGKIVSESIERFKTDGTPDTVSLEMDDILIAAQVFVFFAAGFETSSSATSYTLHQLAYHPEEQKKVQEEIDRVLAKYDNKLCYDAIKEMKYLEMAFKEAMRMFPSLGFLMRECARPVNIPELGINIDEGVGIVIPLQALHNDPKYFEHPEKFRPERFLPENFSAVHKYVYMPFGEGSRTCIGSRLGLMQSLAGLAAVLSRASVSPAPGASRIVTIEPKSHVVQGIQGGLPLVFGQRISSS